MRNTFGHVGIEDVDGIDTAVEVVSIPRIDGPTKLVNLTTHAGTDRWAPVYLDPAGARALARALEEAADHADLLQLEENLI